jgi:hypothetical protein
MPLQDLVIMCAILPIAAGWLPHQTMPFVAYMPSLTVGLQARLIITRTTVPCTQGLNCSANVVLM